MNHQKILDHIGPPQPGTGCRLWLRGRYGSGYGAVRFEGRMRSVTHVLWEYKHGPVPAGMRVCHHCDNPPCCEESHLFIGTPADNMRDMALKGRSGKCCGTANAKARLTEDGVIAARVKYAAGGTSKAALARRHGVSEKAMSCALSGKSWAHVSAVRALRASEVGK